jgi:SAM-dependent methyltransferase/DNA-binding transcriptional ArsR family regulator
MGATNTEHYSDIQNDIAKIAKALGHPARLAIVEHLINVNACICGDIVKELPLAQPTVSQHLKELKNAGIIIGAVEGNSICYCIDKRVIERVIDYFSETLNQSKNQKTRILFINQKQKKMTNESKIKEMVKQKYGEIALQDKETANCGCGSGCCSTEAFNVESENYKTLDGYNPDADLGLGCGLPTQFAKIKKGDVVIDLGSGAGNDCFVARAETGETGKVIGIDFTPEMIEKARFNAEKLGFNNVEFRQGDIENMPVNDNVADVIVSNCVLNLVPNKPAVFKEIYRVLKAGGHFSISDVVLTGDLPPQLKTVAEMYAGCVAGASLKNEYMDFIKQTGFQNITIQKEHPVVLPDDILENHLSKEEIATLRTRPSIVYSITVYAEK